MQIRYRTAFQHFFLQQSIANVLCWDVRETTGESEGVVGRHVSSCRRGRDPSTPQNKEKNIFFLNKKKKQTTT